ncbi:MAG: hypothetical protein ACAF41_25755 [Leptolyngbya sp. BL-A-14]
MPKSPMIRKQAQFAIILTFSQLVATGFTTKRRSKPRRSPLKHA